MDMAALAGTKTRGYGEGEDNNEASQLLSGVGNCDDEQDAAEAELGLAQTWHPPYHPLSTPVFTTLSPSMVSLSPSGCPRWDSKVPNPGLSASLDSGLDVL
jgi:hypothetical protein